MKRMFSLGKLALTSQVHQEVPFSFWFSCLKRHASGDWGDLCKEDKEQNEIGVKEEGRLFSVYNSKYGKLYVITEWDRSYTTILFPHEY